MVKSRPNGLTLFGIVPLDFPGLSEHGVTVSELEASVHDRDFVDLRTGKLYGRSQAYARREELEKELLSQKDEAGVAAALQRLAKLSGSA